MSTQLTNHQGDLEAIKSLLKSRFLPEHRELREFSHRLEKIDMSISAALSRPNVVCKKILEKQQEMVRDLSGRCHQLEVRRDVIMLAEDAEALANSSPDKPQENIAREANKLRNRMEDFLQTHRPSRTNSKFIRFARACIAKAEKKEPVMIRGRDGKLRKVISIESFKSREVTLEMFDLAENLYALASLLYAEKLDEFCANLASRFSEETQKEVIYHVSMTGGDLDQLSDKELRLRTVQGILGYAHDITDYYTDDSPYPPMREVHKIFRDVELISQSEGQDPDKS